MEKSFNLKDIIGKRFSRLVVVKYDKSVRNKNFRNFKHFYICHCDCGNKKSIQRVNLTSKHTKSCGCAKLRRCNENPTWRGHGQISGRFWYHIQHHARTRKLKFNISIQDAWLQYEKQNGKCALTGLPIFTETKKINGRYVHNDASLDRIDSSKGYFKSNIQWVHKDINQMKWDFPIDKFVSLCKLVADHKEIKNESSK